MKMQKSGKTVRTRGKKLVKEVIEKQHIKGNLN